MLMCTYFVYRRFLRCDPGLPRDLQIGCVFAPLPQAPALDLPGVRRLTNDPYLYQSPVWSPDGTLIAVNRNRNAQSVVGAFDEDWEIVLIEIATGEVRELDLGPFAPSAAVFPASWSPDGKELVFDLDELINAEGTPVGIFEGEEHLVLYSIDTGALRELNCPSCGVPVWLGDGSIMAMAASSVILPETSSESANALVRINSASGDLMVTMLLPWLTNWQFPDSEPGGEGHLVAAPFAFSRDGRVALVSTSLNSCTDIWHWQVDSELKPQKLIASPDVEECEPAWSWDGTKIGYTVKDPSYFAPTSLVIATADGSDPVRLLEPTLDTYQIHHPSWSPDGTSISFTYGLFHPTTTSYNTLYVVDVPPELRPERDMTRP